MQMPTEQIKFWVALNQVPRLGTTRFRKLETFFGDLEHAWSAGIGSLRAAGLDARSATAVVEARRQVSPDAELERLERAGVRPVTWHDRNTRPGSSRLTGGPRCFTLRAP